MAGFSSKSRAWLVIALLVVFAVIGGEVVFQRRAARAVSGSRPVAQNLLIVCIDTLRADHVGAYGYGRPTTPTFDQLSRSAVRFAHAYSTASWTVPSVGSILTSLPPWRHGAEMTGETHYLHAGSGPAALRPGVHTLADVLKPQGFHAALLSANPFLYGRFQRSFERAVARRIDAASLTSQALDWLRQRGPHERWFLYLQYMDLHQPNDPPPKYFQYFAPAGEPNEKRHADWEYGTQVNMTDPGFIRFKRHRIAVYDGSLRYVDYELGRLTTGLRELGFGDNTLLIVTADHGEEFWDHAVQESSWHDDPRGLWGIGHGHTLYDEILHVPLLIRGPGWRSPRVEECPVSLLDLAPTALASLGLSVPQVMEGQNLARLGHHCRRRPLVASSLAYGPRDAALRTRRYKLVQRGSRRRLYDLESDPGEEHDLVKERPAIAAQLARLLKAIQHRRLPPKRSSQRMSAETRRELHALGYL